LNLLNQFNNFVDEWLGDLKAELRITAENLLQKGIQIFKNSVPVESGNLKDSITGQIKEVGNSFELIIEVPNAELIYNKSSINSIKLGLILERGRGKGGVRLKRRKDNDSPFAKAGQPTELWFENALSLWESEINL